MRISDWSSDVCSSDLNPGADGDAADCGQPRIGIRAAQRDRTSGVAAEQVIAAAEDSQKLEVCRLCPNGNRAGATRCHLAGDRQGAAALVPYSGRIAGRDRSVAVGAVPVTNIDARIGLLAAMQKVKGTVEPE